MIKIDNKWHFVFCECHGEGVMICHEDDGNTELSLWSYGTGLSKIAWRDRLRAIWHIARTGRPYSDQVILNDVSRKGLINALMREENENVGPVLYSYATTNTNATPTVRSELADAGYAETSIESIIRGVQQEATTYKGSFAKYARETHESI